MSAKSSRLILGGAFLLATLAVGVQAGRIALFAFSPLSTGAQAKNIIEIHKGQGPLEIGKLLSSKGAITDVRSFIWLGRLTRQWKKIKAGEYEVSAAQSPIELFGVITSGVSVAHPVTVREGENMYEIAADIESKQLAPRGRLLALCRDPKFIASLGLRAPFGPSIEGFLFPDTYFFNRSLSPEDMLRQMVRKFEATWTKQDDARAVEMGLTQLQAVTLASIIEKETGSPKERPLISSVFSNRMRKKMKLQSDPTTIYGIWEHYKGNIHKSDLLAPSSYNTYTLPGLPIGPISNPGRDSIEAALNPPQTTYLYFVSHNDGTSEFTSTLEEHNSAVRRFQLDPKAREGKSWRDLSKVTTPTGQ